MSHEPEQRAPVNTAAAMWAQASASDRRTFAAICLALLGLILYLPAAWFPFYQYDDPSYVLDNPPVASGLSWANVKWAFSSLHGDTSYWHPLTWLSHQLDCQLFGLSAGGAHLTNVVIHCAATMALFGFLCEATGRMGRSALVAAIFAAHPLHVESVAWIAERKDVLCGLFYFLGLLAYARYAARPALRTYVLVVVCFVLACMSKPMAVTFPFLLLVLDFWPLARTPWSTKAPDPAPPPGGRHWWILDKLPLVLISLALAAVTMTAQREVGAMASLSALPIEHRIQNALLSYCIYIYKTFAPHSLSIIYTRSQPWPAWSVMLAAAALLWVTLMVLREHRRRPFLLAGWLWFILTLGPAIGIVQVGSQSMADRYTYIPLTGIAMAVVWGGAELLSSHRISLRRQTALSGVLVLVLGGLCARQLAFWRTDLSLFGHAVKTHPDGWIANALYALALAEHNRHAEAMRYFERALQGNPASAYLLRASGDCLLALGKTGPGLELLQRSLKVKPDFIDGRLSLAEVYATHPDEKIRNGARALALAEEALRLASVPRVRNLEVLAAARAETGDYNQARVAATKALLLAKAMRVDQSGADRRLRLYEAGKKFHSARGLRE